MKKRLTALFLCCVLAFGLLTAALTSAVSADDGFAVCTSSGAVTEVSVPRGERVALTAVPGTGSGSAQWQILFSADTDTWVDIAGETSTNIAVSYAMLASVLYENRATIRCRFTARDGTETFSTRVTVTVTDAAAENTVSAESEPVITAKQTVTVSEAASPSEENGFDYAIAPVSLGDETGDAQIKTHYEFKITYTLENGTVVYPPYSASIAEGDTFPETTVAFPTVQGYLPYVGEAQVNSHTFYARPVTEGQTISVVYKPAEVEYTIEYYVQNGEGDGYTLQEDETVERKGLTGSVVGDVDVPVIPGLIALHYEHPTIAADGGTVVKVYYDRRYYLLTLDLDGGVGTTAVYARYGTGISVASPTKAGCTFTGWVVKDEVGDIRVLPQYMPSFNLAYKACWTRVDSQTTVTVIVCGEQADSEDYYTIKTSLFTVTPGTVLTVCEDGRILKCNEEHKHNDDSCYFDAVSDMNGKLWEFKNTVPETITAATDGTTAITLCYDRRQFTLSFYEAEGRPSVATITAKWGANIVSKFEFHPRFFYDYKGRTWQCEDTTLYDEPIQSIAVMPQCNAKFYLVAKAGSDNSENYSDTEKTIYYYVQNVDDKTATSSTWPNGTDGFTLYKTNTARIKYVCYDEEYHEIPGFTRYAANTAGFTEAYSHKEFASSTEMNLYYLRNSYKLTFRGCNNGIARTVDSVRYGASLSEYADYKPDFPGTYLDPNGYVFDGWYTQLGGKGTKVDFTTMTMPAADTVLYAHYVEKNHTVRTFATAEDAADGTNDTAEWTVAHGSVITENKPADPAATDGTTFVSWVYKDANGTEKAFTFDKPVENDMNLYPKFTNDALVSYTVKYICPYGNKTVSDPITGTGVAGTTLTFYAKGGDELYSDCQENYWSEQAFIELTLQSGQTNEATFNYAGNGDDAKTFHTVRYVDTEGNTLKEEKKVEDWRISAVTETAADIEGYVPDGYQKRLVLLPTSLSNQNVITFYYTKDTTHAYYTVTHYTQSADGNTEIYASSKVQGEVGTQCTAASINNIPGFHYNYESKDNVLSGTLTADGLELKIYYMEDKADIRYMVATEGGTISSEREKVNIFSGTPSGCTATPAEGYWFVGWFTDENCTTKVDDNQVSEYNTLVPGKTSYGNKTGYASATYYAKFERDIAALTISVSGCADENQSFLFKVSGEGKEITAVIRGSGSVTIAGLTSGAEYTVTECSWSWRFTPNEQTVTISATEKNKVSFVNTRTILNWLSSEAFLPNAAGTASAN